MEDTPIFDELLRRSGMAPAADTDRRSQLEHEPPVVAPAAGRNPPAKIVVAGGAGVGKTTFVGSVSEIAPLDTDAWATGAREGADPTDPGRDMTTTAAMDFGRLALHPDVVLYLFGTGEPPPSWLDGALGAVVLVDTGRVEESFAAVNYFENDSDVPFIVAVNMFDGQLAHDLDEVREALALAPEVPLTTCDARDPGSTAKALLELVSYTKNLTES